jgi:hypothetical protein
LTDRNGIEKEGVGMLNKKQLEDAAKGCNREKPCKECEMYNTGDLVSDCIRILAKTALVYREMLEKIVDHRNEADKMFLFADKAEKLLKEVEG